MSKQVKLDAFLRENTTKNVEESREEIQGAYDLPEGWRWVKLKEVLKEDRQSINPQDYPDKEFFLVTMDCIESNSGRLLKTVKRLGKEIKSMKYKFDTRHILYGKLRPYLNKVYVPEREGICTTEFIPFIVTKALREYVAYYLRRRETVNFAMSHITGTRQPRVIINAFLEHLIPIPPLEEQKRIVSRLEQLVNRAEEAKRLRKLAREEAEKIMQAALNKVFNRAEEKEWKYVKLGSIARISAGGTPKRSIKEYWNGDIPWVKILDIPEDGVVLDTQERITEDGLKNSRAKVFPKGTILFSIFATIAKVGILGIDAATNQAIAGIQIRDDRIVDRKYLFYCLKNFGSSLLIIGRGIAQRNINQTILKNLEIPLPSLEEQKRIATYLDKISETIDFLKKLQQKTEDELEKLVPSILDKAFRGEL